MYRRARVDLRLVLFTYPLWVTASRYSDGNGTYRYQAWWRMKYMSCGRCERVSAVHNLVVVNPEV